MKLRIFQLRYVLLPIVSLLSTALIASEIAHSPSTEIDRFTPLSITAAINDSAGIKDTRVYFKASKAPNSAYSSHFIVLEKVSDSIVYKGLIPGVDQTIEGIDYVIVVRNNELEITKSEVYSVTVMPSADGIEGTQLPSEEGFLQVYSELPEDESDRGGFVGNIATSYNQAVLFDQSAQAFSMASSSSGTSGSATAASAGAASSSGVAAAGAVGAGTIGVASTAAATGTTGTSVAGAGSVAAASTAGAGAGAGSAGAAAATTAGVAGATAGVSTVAIVAGSAVVAGGVAVAATNEDSKDENISTEVASDEVINDVFDVPSSVIDEPAGPVIEPTVDNDITANWLLSISPVAPTPEDEITATVTGIESGTTVEFEVFGGDGYRNDGALVSDISGEIRIFIPSGGNSATDYIRIAAPELGGDAVKVFEINYL